ncbi:MAG: YggT family protein [Deltaproteobacteria bacterium]|nr:MAG: YggT family protein [Deltaproteobacteria bacterium]
MFILGNFLKALAAIIDIGLTFYMWVVIARAIVSWVNPDPYNPIVVFLRRATDPVLIPIRRKLPIGGMGIDFSPFIVILGIIFLQKFLVDTLYQLALRLH